MDNSKTKVVVVGNGSSLNGKKQGELIDSFDKVVRLNKYLIDGYEEDVGYKTDSVMMNAKSFVHHFSDNDLIDRLESLDEVIAIIRGDRELNQYIDVLKRGYIGKMALDLMERYENMYPLDMKLVRDFHDMLGIKTPCVCCERSGDLLVSTGMYAIGHYLREGYDVSIIGFDSMDLHMKFDENGWDVDADKLLHYQGVGLLNVGLEHKVFEEARLLRGLTNLGIIKRLDS